MQQKLLHPDVAVLSPVPCLAMGRYVSIILGGRGKILTLCEVQVLGTTLPCDSTTGQCEYAYDARQALRDMVNNNAWCAAFVETPYLVSNCAMRTGVRRREKTSERADA